MRAGPDSRQDVNARGRISVRRSYGPHRPSRRSRPGAPRWGACSLLEHRRGAKGPAIMNKIQRRLFRAFLDSGGDITDEVELERFVRYVEAVLSLLPPKLRLAVDLAWRAPDSSPYVRVAGILSQREGTQVSPQALRQRGS